MQTSQIHTNSTNASLIYLDTTTDNFTRAKEMSANAKENRTVFPSGLKATVINPNAKPFKLNPPQ